MLLLSENQQLYIQQGALNRKRLKEAVNRAIDRTTLRDFYIYSPPGLGKSYTVEKAFRDHNLRPTIIKGNTSLFGFTVDMALICQYRDPKQHMFLFIDDCDNLLLHKDSVNTLKIALNDNVLNYNKTLSAQYNQLEDIQKGAIDHFRVPGRNAVSIPLDNMTIIWCSNYKLADQQDLVKVRDNDSTYQKYIDEVALRRRLNARDYDVTGDLLWGWIADCVLNETPPAMAASSRLEREQILAWMHSNLKRLKEHNISFAEKLYEEMVINPDSYLTNWEYDYLID